jgi:DNA modification methylase
MSKIKPEHLLAIYEDSTLVDNHTLYSEVASSLGICELEQNSKTHPDKSGTQYNLFKRSVRWAQQSLKQSGMISKIKRGQWSLTNEGRHVLTKINVDKYMIAASTDLGVVIWGNSTHVFDKVINEDIHLCFTSPPYFNIERSYGTYRNEQEYIDFIISVLGPIRRKMAPGANLALNMTNDSMLKKQFGERSLYLEKTILALSSELDFHLMDRLMWHAPDKAPKSYPVTHLRTHLTAKYEPILWFCTDPSLCLADNKRVLNPYSGQMQRMLDNGGDLRTKTNPDYAPNSRTGGFSKDNGGSIAGNIITIPTYCGFNRDVLKHAKELGLPTHGALFPVALASFIVKWLCPPGGLSVDPFGGYGTLGFAAETNNRFWAVCESSWEYIKPSLIRFATKDGYYVNPLFERVHDSHQL